MTYREDPPGTRKQPQRPMDDDYDIPLRGLGWGEILLITAAAVLLIIATATSHGCSL